MSKSRPPRRPLPEEPAEDSPDDELPEDEALAAEAELKAVGAGDDDADDDSGPDVGIFAVAPTEGPAETRRGGGGRSVQPATVTPTFSSEEQAYRNARLGDRTIMERLARRYAKKLRRFGDLSPEDFVAGTIVRALASATFPREHETIFPWIYRVANAELQKMIRHATRQGERFTGYDAVRDHAAEAPPELSDAQQAKLDFVEKLSASDSGARKAVAAFTAIAEGVPARDVEDLYGVKAETLQRRAYRFFEKVRERAARNPALVSGASIATALLLYVVVSVTHAPAMDDPGNGTPLAIGEERLPPPMAPDPRVMHQLTLQLRDEAVQACAAKQWSDCSAKLNAVVSAEPRMENDPAVKKARDDMYYETESKRPR